MFHHGRYLNPELNDLRGGANLTLPVKQDDRFIIWMRLAPLPKFRKLWGVISDRDLLAGDTVTVQVGGPAHFLRCDMLWLLSTVAVLIWWRCR